MIVYDIVLSDLAYHSLDEVYDYIYFILENPMAAERIKSGILKRCNSLRIMPKAYLARHKRGETELRLVHSGTYTIVYYVDDKNKKVVIHDIIYSRRDIVKLLSD